MNVNFGLFPPHRPKGSKGKDRKQAMSARALAGSGSNGWETEAAE